MKGEANSVLVGCEPRMWGGDIPLKWESLPSLGRAGLVQGRATERERERHVLGGIQKRGGEKEYIDFNLRYYRISIIWGPKGRSDTCDSGLAALRATRLVWEESEAPLEAAVGGERKLISDGKPILIDANFQGHFSFLTFLTHQFAVLLLPSLRSSAFYSDFTAPSKFFQN